MGWEGMQSKRENAIILAQKMEVEDAVRRALVRADVVGVCILLHASGLTIVFGVLRQHDTDLLVYGPTK